MRNSDRWLIYILLLLIILSSIILIVKIKGKDQYNKDIYEEIYKEYEQITKIKSEKNNVENESSSERTYIHKFTRNNNESYWRNLHT